MSPDLVRDRARAYVAEMLGWKITDTVHGFTAEGSSFAHRSIADFRFESSGEGTRAVVDLKVERAGGAGFMLFDVGGTTTFKFASGSMAFRRAFIKR